MTQESGVVDPGLSASQSNRQSMISDVVRGYGLFLGRGLEGVSIAGFHIANSPELWGLVETIYNCPEAQYRRICQSFERVRSLHPEENGSVTASDEQLQELYALTVEQWRLRGPGRYHLELTRGEPRFEARSVRWNLQGILERGRAEGADLFARLGKHGWRVEPGATMTVLGVEAYRLLDAAESADLKFVGAELADADLEWSRKAAEMRDIAGAQACEATSFNSHMPPSDIFYSVSALQYAPPPVILDMLGQALRQVKCGGFAAFQLPSHLHAYRFSTEGYLAGEGRIEAGELHCVHQAEILSLLAKEGFYTLEVIPDERAGSFGFSYFFIARKARASRRPPVEVSDAPCSGT